MLCCMALRRSVSAMITNAFRADRSWQRPADPTPHDSKMAAMKLARAPAAFATGRKAAAPRTSVAVRASNNPNLECKQPILPVILAVRSCILFGTTHLRFFLLAHAQCFDRSIPALCFRVLPCVVGCSCSCSKRLYAMLVCNMSCCQCAM